MMKPHTGLVDPCDRNAQGPGYFPPSPRLRREHWQPSLPLSGRTEVSLIHLAVRPGIVSVASRPEKTLVPGQGCWKPLLAEGSVFMMARHSPVSAGPPCWRGLRQYHPSPKMGGLPHSSCPSGWPNLLVKEMRNPPAHVDAPANRAGRSF